MKKIEYQAPEMEVIELKHQVSLLAGSGGSGSTGPSTSVDD